MQTVVSYNSFLFDTDNFLTNMKKVHIFFQTIGSSLIIISPFSIPFLVRLFPNFYCIFSSYISSLGMKGDISRRNPEADNYKLRLFVKDFELPKLNFVKITRSHSVGTDLFDNNSPRSSCNPFHSTLGTALAPIRPATNPTVGLAHATRLNPTLLPPVQEMVVLLLRKVI